MNKNQIAQEGHKAAIDTERLPTPEELYRTAVMVEEAAVIMGILCMSSLSELQTSQTLGFFSDVLLAASETLTNGLDETEGTFSRLSDVKKRA